MKLTAILLLAICLNVHARGFSQYVNLSEQGAPLEKVFSEINKQTGYSFVYRKMLLKKAKRVTVNLTKASLKQVLDVCLQDQPLTYSIVDKVVVIKERAEAPKREPIHAQVVQAVVTGKVANDKGEPLAGVSVSEVGTTNMTITKDDGSFALTVTGPDAVLQFSSVGFAKRQVPVSGQSSLHVTLQQVNASLNEVVIIGYGAQKRANVTSAVATVKAENFVKGPVTDAAQLIQGKVAGLSIATPSGDPTGGSQILLRGNTTLLGANSNPLVLIDGIPGDLKTVAPEDIESMDVLKDGSAAAIYGVRGTNGVIIITTRRASGNNINAVDYSGSVSTQRIARKMNMLTAEDYRKQIADGSRASSWDLGSSTDWLDEVTQTPISHVHNLTFRGGNSRTNYLANLNYRYFEGIFKKSDNATFTGRMDVNHAMFDNKLKINVGLLNASNRYTTTGDGQSFNGYTYRQALIRNPTSPVRDSAGNWFEQVSLFNYENPLARLYESDGRNSSQNTRLNANLSLTPVKGLRLASLFSYTRYNQTRGYSETKRHISTLRDARNGYASVGNDQSIDRLMELTAEYTHNITDHRMTLLGGYSYQENDFMGSWMQNWDFPTDIFGYSGIGMGDALKRGIAPQSSTRAETNLIGFFGRATYSYKEKYLLMANLRREAASQLYGTNKPWGTFPALSLGWRISQEGFMQGQHLFDDLKLRAGYGVTGTQPTTPFMGLGTLAYGAYIYNNGRWIQTLAPARNPNPYLRWEEKHESNLGLDFSLLKGRISGNLDYYRRRIEGLLYDFQVPTPPNTFATTRANAGVMENKGLEVLLNFVPVQQKDFVWNTSVNFSTNANKLISLSTETYTTTNDYFTSGGTGEPIQTFTHIVKVGQNIGDFYGFKVVDVTDKGEWIYEDKDGKAVPRSQFAQTFENKKVLGNGLPKYYAGWNNNLRYKNLDLAVTMRGAFGYQILNFQRMYYENTNLQQYNRLKSAYDPVFSKAVLSKDMPLEFNSYYIEDGDFWKIDNITLGYNLKNTGLKAIRSARVFASTLNTFILTGYKGIDPEVNRIGLNPGNDDRDKYPTTRTFTLGVNLSF
ncbi:SusC/RagA family TonB-linked outer membrane protein [Paraflavisolibacter sp. H34]|uniref:SusC/RagA family TonB-linked outer membrane protein n=1 Tax=Huijunlia imazamoxiresistens TaxID=3127457 RepID=UPI0030160523